MRKSSSNTPSLFERTHETELAKDQPLAARMRPRTLDEYIGQEHILAPGRLLRRAVQADQISSLLFYGPPGTGKTTLASVIANTTKSFFVTLNAVMAGIADLRDVTTSAQRRLLEFGQRTILFVDEVHRWNKAQQDALLPWVENGTIILIGATTENPYFTVNRALVSRSRIFQLKPLEEKHIRLIIQQALQDKERGYGNLQVVMDNDALDHIANIANGDARAALNAIELAVETTPPDANNTIHITMEVAEESIQRRAVLYDREGDCHFDTISAFIKSMRGSDPDATFYWLAKMVYAGEDPRFIFRRMTIFASEDIGMADPHAVQFVTAAAEAFDRVGLPEGHYPLAHAALYCATAPKSNSVMGFFDALKAVEQEKEGEVPNHLRDGSRDKEGFGHGVGYQYPHAYKDHWVAQQYLPSTLQGKIFYEPGTIGYEKGLADIVRQRRELQIAALRENENASAPPEILTFTKPGDKTDKWLARALDNTSATLAVIREGIFAARKLQRHERVLDLTADTGELTLEAVRAVPEGGVWSLVSTPEAATALQDLVQNITELRRPNIIVGWGNDDVSSSVPSPSSHSPSLLSQLGQVRFELIVARNLLSCTPDKVARLTAISHLLADGGTISLAENLPRRSQRLNALLPSPTIPEEASILSRIAAAEEAVYHDPNDPRVSMDVDEIIEAFQAAGLGEPTCRIEEMPRPQLITRQLIDRWFSNAPESFANALERHGLAQEDIDWFRNAITSNLLNQKVNWHFSVAFVKK
ncbi:MAG: AAA family ATPase [Victivallales bacterium]|nr:AAA family ATPase [Victivallales bacterium]